MSEAFSFGVASEEVMDRVSNILDAEPGEVPESDGTVDAIDVLEATEGMEVTEATEATEGTEEEATKETVEADAAEPKQEKVSTRLKKLAREEAKVRREAEKKVSEVEAMRAEALEYQNHLTQRYEKLKHLEHIQELAYNDPWKFVELTGIDMDKLTDAFVSSGKHKTYEKDPEVVGQLARLERLVAEKFGAADAAKKAEEERMVAAQRDAALRTEHSSLVSFGEGKMGDYPILAADCGGKAEDMASRLFEAKVAFFQAGQKVTTEEAARYLESELEKHYERIAGVAMKKRGEKPGATKRAQTTVDGTAKTAAKVPTYGKTDEERMARAYALLGMEKPPHL